MANISENININMTFHNGKRRYISFTISAWIEAAVYREITRSLKMPFTDTRSLIKHKAL